VVAELWSALPPARNLAVLEAVSPIEAEVEPAPVQAKPVIPPVVEKVAPVPFKADLELKAKREEDAKAKRKTALELMERKQREEAKAFESRKLAEAEKRRLDDDLQKRLIAENQRKEQEERENAARAANSAAVREYGAKIAALVRSRANIPDTVSGKPVVQLRLRLLVNGVVFDAQVIKPSGNRVYDEAVERAINGIRQWPLPESAELFGGKRELTLNIEHER
jgi:colicin import membrane protein